MTTDKIMPISKAAPAVPTSESTLRRLGDRGVVHPIRDMWNRRIYGDDDVIAARRALGLEVEAA